MGYGGILFVFQQERYAFSKGAVLTTDTDVSKRQLAAKQSSTCIGTTKMRALPLFTTVFSETGNGIMPKLGASLLPYPPGSAEAGQLWNWRDPERSRSYSKMTLLKTLTR